MRGALAAEARKLFTHRALWWVALAGAGLPILLAWFNGSGARQDLTAGHADRVTEDLNVIGSGELLLAAAAAAAIGVIAMGSEYVTAPEERGGGRQATTTALAVPSRARVLGAKLVVVAVALILLAGVAAFGALLTAQGALGEYALPLDADRWTTGARGMTYIASYGLLGLAVTAVLRNGLIPLVYLVANQTVVSVGYLLTLRTELAWYLPDTAAMGLIKDPPDPGQPTALVSGVVAIAWVLVFLVVAVVLDRRRDA